MRLVRQAIASNSASIRNVLTEGSNSKPPTTTEDNASHIRLHSLRVSSDRALAQLLFGRGVSIIFLSIVVASVFLFLLIAGSIPEFWQTVWREGVGPMLLSLLLVALLLLLHSRIVLPSRGVLRAISEANHLLRGATVDADDAGIRWTGGAWGKHAFKAAWSDITSFFVVRTEGRVGRDADVYVLCAPVANLVWESPAKANSQQDHERFIAYVLARTGLSLRELSLTRAAPQQMDATSPSQSQLEQTISLTLSRVIERATRAQRTGVSNAWLVMILGALLLIGCPWGAQLAQTRNYEALMATVTSQSPVYQASLSQPSSDWPALEIDSTGRARTYYQDGLFHLTGSSRADKPRIVTAHILNEYRDAAVAVTARQLADAPASPVGLLLRYTGTPERFTALVFAANGEWALRSYDSSGPSGHPGKVLLSGLLSGDGSVNKGVGKSNKLLVIMRGEEYACYINGRFVGKAFDSLIESGSPGVVSYDNSTVAAFSDFAVYPV
jgi:hypothetical protein